jgi:ABC-type lipoprotein export system ATPase subunit
MKLEAHDVSQRYGDFVALDRVHFATGDDARVVALLGPSGGGKSTLLRVLGGLRIPDSGEVRLDGESLPRDARGALGSLRQNGFVFQGYNLFPHLTALQNIVLPLCAVHGWAETEARDRAHELLMRLGLAGHEHKRPAELSGGQQQRAAIARALASKPRLLLLFWTSCVNWPKPASKLSWLPMRSVSPGMWPTGWCSWPPVAWRNPALPLLFLPNLAQHWLGNIWMAWPGTDKICGVCNKDR